MVGERLSGAVLRGADRGEIVEDPRGLRVIGTARLLHDRQRTLVEPLGVAVTALVHVDARKITEDGCHERVIGAERFLLNGGGTLEQLLGIVVTALAVIATASFRNILATSG